MWHPSFEGTKFGLLNVVTGALALAVKNAGRVRLLLFPTNIPTTSWPLALSIFSKVRA
jgi:hypothetical protein